jgi:hypothetical protein
MKAQCVHEGMRVQCSAVQLRLVVGERVSRVSTVLIHSIVRMPQQPPVHLRNPCTSIAA